MTVHELITMLNQCDPYALVVLSDGNPIEHCYIESKGEVILADKYDL